MIKGIGASNGYAIAKAYRLVLPDLSITKVTIADTHAEIKRLEEAIDKTEVALVKIKEKALKSLSEDEASVFDAHILVLKDPEMKDQIVAMVESSKVNVEYALNEVAQMFINMLEMMDDEYMRERAADIKDVTTRLRATLLGKTLPDPSQIDQEVVVVAYDLTPSDTAQLDRRFVKGFATNIGGRTSHSAIMARSLEIPAVVGTKSILEDVNDGDMMILDGKEGLIIINPTDQQILEYEAKASAYEAQKVEWAKLKDTVSMSKDGHHVELSGNIGNPEDAINVAANGGEGVGLYRTEFLYMGKTSMPTEEEQFDAYKQVLETMGGKLVVVRTLDIGGDKSLPYLKLPHEENPFLGYRAIRICLEDEPLFRTQLRALLRASAYGNLGIMFPMIATIQELRKAKTILFEEKDKLVSEGIKVGENLQVGMMVEIPASAILADQFAKEVDFFSIGTNDLIQYSMAADRMNERVSYLYQPYNPSILRLIKLVIDASHKEGKWTGMCGEMAGELMALPLLLGLGLDEFSMSASSILPARSLLAKLSKEEMASLATKALEQSTAEEVVELVAPFVSE